MRFTKFAFLATLLLLAATARNTTADQTIYADALTNAWEDWSWATVSLTATSPVYSGTHAIRVTPGAWEALRLNHAAMDTTGYSNLMFRIHGGATGGQLLLVQALRGTTPQTAVNLPPLTNTWQLLTLNLSALAVSNVSDFTGFWIQDRSGAAQPAFFVDAIALQGAPPTPPATNAPALIVIDAARDRHPIDPRIYGVAFASTGTLAALNAPLNRSGGNSETRYNWQTNAHNHAMDWYFESLADDSPIPGAAADAFVAATRAANADAMLTIPMIGWAPTLGPNRQRRASYSIAKYGAQTANDWEWFADAGNGIRTSNGQPITTNNPNDANMPVGVDFQSNWVQHLVGTWGTSATGGVRYYCLDNEHSIWHETHRDVHPAGATMEEIRDRMTTYATMAKSIDPAALTVGPEEFGWSGYLYSGADLQYGNTHGWGGPLPDRVAHGNMDYMPWLLDQLRQRSETAGLRLLDVFSLHIYPQGGEFGNDTSPAMQLRRNRSTRALWDTNYVDETWINDVVMLIPRMKAWVAQYYPNTPIGITEYNWGAENHINGATAQADVLGIFGREGLDIATRWVAPNPASPVGNAMQLYRNYDGQRATFGDISLHASGPSPDQLAVFAAERTWDGALTVMAVHKSLTGSASATVVLSNFPAASPAQAWQLTSANIIAHLPDITVTGAVFTATLPPQSITLYVIPRLPRPRLGALTPNSYGLDLRLDGTPGQTYAVESSTDLVSWTGTSTNLLASTNAWFAISTNGPRGFFRAVWRP